MHPTSPDPTQEQDPAAVRAAQDALRQRICSRWDLAYDGVHKRARTKWERFYALYSNFTDWRESQGAVDRRDRDMGLREAKREWGAELFIPYAFSTVEEVLPRILSNTPRVIVKPKGPKWATNAPNMKSIIDSQFLAIDYELILQRICRDALIYGIGVQKTYWAKQVKTLNELAQPTVPMPGVEWVSVPQEKTLRDDPVLEWVDPWDFVWDPFAADVQKAEWVIHRSWRSTDYVCRLLESGVWSGVSKDDVEMGPGGSAKYTEAWSKRMRVDGYKDFKAPSVHEVWEYHDGEQVVTVLDRQWIVQQGPNPAWHGELPFQVYRPTPNNGRMVGRGEIEPIEDLQAEINTMRSQRRDNATFVLQRSFFYADGMIDPGDFKVGPGTGTPVLGNPNEVVAPIPVGDIPNSGYQEESALMSDFFRTSGLQDTTGGGVNETATGAQLVYQSVGQRIKQKTRNCEIELVRAGGRQVLKLNQQKILAARDVRMPATPLPGEPDSRWTWKQVGPAELAGEFELDVEGGSLAAENVPQMRSDAQMMMGLLANPNVNQEHGLRFALKNMGIDDPESFVVARPPVPQVPAAALELLKQAGVDEGLIAQAVAAVSQPPKQ